MRFNKKWTRFWVEAEIEMFGPDRLIKDHNELDQRCSDLSTKLNHLTVTHNELITHHKEHHKDQP